MQVGMTTTGLFYGRTQKIKWAAFLTVRGLFAARAPSVSHIEAALLWPKALIKNTRHASAFELLRNNGTIEHDRVLHKLKYDDESCRSPLILSTG